MSGRGKGGKGLAGMSRSDHGDDQINHDGSDQTSIAEDLQARARPFLDLVDCLRKDGVHNEIEIPQIAVMGDQSSGKSSVLEAISGIQFPRGAGLVTRCATQITMSQGPEWSAELHADDEVRIVKAGEETELTRHIKELTVKMCGEETFCGKDKRIEVKLQAPDAPDLTIIDLPGIVRTTTTGQSHMVKEQVDELLKHYLEQSRTIILAVIPCNVDIATVDILERATKVDPGGERTIGVLTKPDLVDKGGESEVMKVLTNETKPLRHGYFMLKNKSQEQLQDDTIQRSEARHAERTWLANSKYAGSDRLGVGVLQLALTDLLVSRIQVALPSMLEEVGTALAQTEEKIALLGEESPQEPRGRRLVADRIIRDVLGSLRRVTSEVALQTCDGPHVLQRERKARGEFVTAMDATRPGFDGEDDLFDIEVTEVCPTSEDEKKLEPGVYRKSVTNVLRSTRAWTEHDVTRKDQEIISSYPKSGYTKGKIIRIVKHFRRDLAEQIQAGRGRELPGFMSFDVFCSLMGGYVDRWKGPTADFQGKVKQAMNDAVEFTVRTFANHVPSLADELHKQLKGHLESCKAEADDRLAKLLDAEKMPSTENHYLWDTINKTRNKRLENKINDMGTGSSVSKASVIAILRSDIGNDSNESQEVQDMIDYLSAYWKLAMKRYVDEVGMIVTQSYTAPQCLRVLERKLAEAISAADDEALGHLFQQEKTNVRRRSELKAKRDKLNAANARITNFMHAR